MLKNGVLELVQLAISLFGLLGLELQVVPHEKQLRNLVLQKKLEKQRIINFCQSPAYELEKLKLKLANINKLENPSFFFIGC